MPFAVSYVSRTIIAFFAILALAACSQYAGDKRTAAPRAPPTDGRNQFITN